MSPGATKQDIENHVVQVRQWSNRAEDWIASCRDYPLPYTQGAFINFKDSSVRTQDYFGTPANYQKLVETKLKFVRDDKMLFKTAKTIV